ncbi:MAG: ChaN family lipoprotein [Leptospiraceae bacterium]|nr:ChaN family lipoprotein [Leptospiraceae bacterium]
MLRLNLILLVSIISVFDSLYSKDLPVYQIYSKEGKRVEFSQLAEQAKTQDVILFGEIHNNPVSHWLRLELAIQLIKQELKPLALGAEMLEFDQQPFINQYLKNEIDFDTLGTNISLWSNFKTDYLPFLNLARDKNIPFIASNLPRSLARRISFEGDEFLSSLTDEQKKNLPQLPLEVNFDLPAYKAMRTMSHAAHAGISADNMIKAQACKDATMALHINSSVLAKRLVLHANGKYHSDNWEGIYFYLKKLNNKTKILTITTIEADNVLNSNGLALSNADYTIVVHSRFTKTY